MHILDLPNEISFSIFSYLSIQSQAQAASTCKKWKVLLEDDHLWRYYYLRDFLLQFPKQRPSWKEHYFVSCMHFVPNALKLSENLIMVALKSSFKVFEDQKPLSHQFLAWQHSFKTTSSKTLFFDAHYPVLAIGSMSGSLQLVFFENNHLSTIKKHPHKSAITALDYKSSSLATTSAKRVTRVWDLSNLSTIVKKQKIHHASIATEIKLGNQFLIIGLMHGQLTGFKKYKKKFKKCWSYSLLPPFHIAIWEHSTIWLGVTHQKNQVSFFKWKENTFHLIHTTTLKNKVITSMCQSKAPGNLFIGTYDGQIIVIKKDRLKENWTASLLYEREEKHPITALDYKQSRTFEPSTLCYVTAKKVETLELILVEKNLTGVPVNSILLE